MGGKLLARKSRRFIFRALLRLAAQIRRVYGRHPVLQASLHIPPDCGWSVHEENAPAVAAKMGYRIRKHPFPYNCSVAINNDTDGLDFDTFSSFHAFVSGTDETAHGPGLGLEVGNSFWIWSTSSRLSLYHSSPWDPEEKPSAEHERILELAHAGWLDSLHGFGDWPDDDLLSRSQVSQALDYLDHHNVKLQVYSNHGGLNMAHNVGGPWGYYQQADNPKHASYCMDLLEDYGFRYYWTDVMYETEKFGEDLSFHSQRELNQMVEAHDFDRYFRGNDAHDFTQSRVIFPEINAGGRTAWKRALFNRVLIPAEVRDGRRAFFYKRFRGYDGPCAGNFVLQVNSQTLDNLEARGGSVIIYQHFGVWRALMAGKGHASARNSQPESVLDEHNLWAFRTLAERFQTGRVLVCTTQRLLNYIWMRDFLEFEVANCSGVDVIRVTGITCPVRGHLVPTIADLEGLAFEGPSGSAPRVQLGEQEIEMSLSQETGIDNCWVSYRPWTSLEYPA